MKEDSESPPAKPVVPVKCRSERRAAQIASTKIAESAKILASSKIIATGRSPGASGKDPTYHVRSPRGRGRGGASARGRAATSAPVLLPKMPVLVFNPSTGLTSPMQSFIPATSISSFGTTTATSRTKPVVLSTGKSNAPIVISTPSAKRKSNGSTSNSKHSTGLIMECEDDALTPIQWSTYKKAENDYLEVLRKLSKWKSRADVEIVRIGADDPIPPVPEFLSVSEAAKLPLPSVTATYENVKPSQTVTVKQTNVPAQLPKGTVISAGQAHLIIRPVSQPSTATSSSGPQASVASKASPLPPGQGIRLLHLYGKPRRTANKNFAASLFASGRNIEEISSILSVTPAVIEVYLIDSVFLEENVDYMRLCHILKVTKNMIEHVSKVIRHNTGISLAKLQSSTMYSYNQIRLCVALLHHGLKWKAV